MRNAIVLAGAVIVLAVANIGIYQKEQLLAHGRVVMLELAPVDPRSLMQGDYMALRFRVASEALGAQSPDTNRDGRLVLTLDAQRVGHFLRFDDGQPIEPGHVAVRWRVRGGTPKFATNAFFFQEGTGDSYARARYGEFRVGTDGDMVLTALRGEKMEVLGPPR